MRALLVGGSSSGQRIDLLTDAESVRIPAPFTAAAPVVGALAMTVETYVRRDLGIMRGMVVRCYVWAGMSDVEAEREAWRLLLVPNVAELLR